MMQTELPEFGLLPVKTHESGVGADLEAILLTEELASRPSRPPNYALENTALVKLAGVLTASPERILQTLVEAALELCQAQSAGISLLQSEGKHFSWPAVAGIWADRAGSGTPRDHSACGVVLDRNAAQLMSRVERYFPCLQQVTPLAEETLLVPFYLEGKAVGTVWVVAHDQRRRFDREDLRVMNSLGTFAGAAWQIIEYQSALRESRKQVSSELEDTKLLQSLSAEMICEEDVQALYEKIMDAAVIIMRSDFASMQAYYPERGASGQLRLLAWRGFNPEAVRFWEWVHCDSQCTCGMAMRCGRRVIVADVDNCPVMAGTADQATYQQTGIAAVQSTPLLSRGGKLLGMISTHWRTPHQPSERDLRLLDILARQAADLIERRRAEEKLEQTVADRTEKLREAVGELESFSYSVSHDMRAPLRTMVGFAQLLIEDYGTQLDDIAKNYLNRISNGATRLDRLVTDLLTYTRIERMTLPVEPVDLDRLVRELLRDDPNLQSPHVEIQIQGPLPKVVGHEVSLMQVVSNLLVNGVKFVAPGVSPRITISSQTLGVDARVWFSDNGIGIAPDDLSRIFSLFGRLHPASLYAGTGIGLTIVRKAIQRMGGTVGVESQLGQGSRFWIQLNISPSEVK